MESRAWSIEMVCPGGFNPLLRTEYASPISSCIHEVVTILAKSILGLEFIVCEFLRDYMGSVYDPPREFLDDGHQSVSD